MSKELYVSPSLESHARATGSLRFFHIIEDSGYSVHSHMALHTRLCWKDALDLCPSVSDRVLVDGGFHFQHVRCSY